MKEIGGYFGMETFSGNEYHCDLVGVNSGRNALLYIVKARGYRKLYIPRFLCDSIAAMCRREGYAFEEYPVGADLLPVFNRQLQQEEALYVVNFFGQLTDAQVLELKSRHERVILDNVQDFFRRPLSGVDTIYSCRKFFGVPDGGYAACSGADLPLELDKSGDRMGHIIGRFEESGSAYYSEFQSHDARFRSLPLREMSRLTRNILRAVDYEAVRRRRNENYAKLHEALGASNDLQLLESDGPYCYPYLFKNGMELKRVLAAEKVYVATLWPNVLAYEGTLEKKYAENILPLPVDQRYGADEMDRIVALVRTAQKR